MKRIFLYLLGSMLLQYACESKQDAPANGEPILSTDAVADSLSDIGYQISRPAQTYTLPGSLQELSGMQQLSETLVACIQDEEGKIFMFDLEKGQVVQEIAWGGPGDYEGLAGTRDELWVLESNGTLNRIQNLEEGQTPTVKKITTPLTSACDAEGLSLIPDDNALLIACKEGQTGERNFWRFDLETEQLDPEPYLTLDHAEMEKRLIQNGLDKISLALHKFLDVSGESGVFVPSGLAFHPRSGDLFILSAASKILVVVDKSGSVSYIQELPSQTFLQPESITFTPNGSLLIGNEGTGGDPTILLFTYDEL